MKTMFKTMLVLAIAAALTNDLQAQGLKMPQPSTAQTITQNFGLGKITLNYSRPNVKGRKIFGAMEPYGTVWRTGANSATVISFTEPVKIEGKELPAGDYGLFTIPGKDEWTVIFNKGAKQWGAYEYKEAEDVLRVKVKAIKLKDKVETFTMQFANVLPATAQLQLMWENTAVNVELSTEIDATVMASIDEAMKGEKKPYFQAAQYYYSNGKDLNKALEWINAAEAADGKAPWIKLWKGRIQLKMGDKVGATKSATAGLQLATEMKNQEYVRLHTELLNEAKK
ncbi:MULTISPECIES: DUF2911 domain-containing protein [Pedobacter]|uniref:DUF2911 domain-containing protein n=1 Tax=Pedobacter heparinus (strain ATCC 13125 / DSM 2366 / CIP 104194 / JCM 7457 / NBRC 12017 / NCIMB 9290 / NRRL B-14731 / HIM 762-3) TaxID=485917 RepID=C6XT42_PEDHD|nr:MULTISPECIES: DUF2911 domain-containing protein [Pedobacter]ACU03603.1 conserved hypothetical protein [Pedobacter heparinus DSM 2366]MBB5436885.1 hypothetical protein [Pedobacter sp. AK017]